MTSAASQPASQQQHPNAPYPPSVHVATQSQGPSSPSPPNRRDLKSWWKGFKLPSRHQETHGTEAPFTRPRPKPRFRMESIFVEDLEGIYDKHPSSPLLQGTVSEEEGNLVHQASASLSRSSNSSVLEELKMDDATRILPWRLIRCTGALFPRLCPAPAKLTEAEPPKGIFGVPLRQSITYANVAISLIDEHGKSYIYGYVPIVVAKCGVFLKEKATEVEGIFRLSGSEKRIKELKNIFDSPDRYGKGLIWDGYTVHDAANVLRRYLNDLPEPVVPLDLYESFRQPLKGATKQPLGDGDGPQFVDNFDLDTAITRYQQLITELPPLNKQLLLYILDLLAVFAAKSEQNRMNSQNLAAIFQPGMLSHPNHAMAPDEYRLNQTVIIFLIENQDNFLIGMQGTAADERIVREFEKGTPLVNTPKTPVPNRKSGVSRSASIASAGAESVAKEGQIRRNKSTSSRRSFQSNGAPSPRAGSPALAVTPTGGLARSNTLPSKKSPALQSGKFASRNNPSSTPVAPLTPVTPSAGAVVYPPEVVEEVATPPEEPLAPSVPPSIGGGSSLAPGQSSVAGRSQERLLGPGPEAATPSKERKLPAIFQRSPTGDSETRQPNKLRKKMPASPNRSAHSSTASLPYSAAAAAAAASPNAELVNPLETMPAPAEKVAEEGLNQAQPAVTPAESTPRASQVPSNNSVQPHKGEPTLKPKTSPPTSLHSSFNEGSDLDRVEDPASGSATSPTDVQSEKERKKRWRLSRKKEDTPPDAHPPLTSPRTLLGSNAHAEMSTSTVGSSVLKPQQSLTGESSDLTAVVSTDAPSSNESSQAGRENRDDQKSIAGWLKNKYREHKETVEQRRAKSPPADRSAPLGGSLLPTRGKSLDIKRTTQDENHAPPQPLKQQQPNAPQ